MVSATTKALLTLAVFAIGAGLGLGLRQGWLPVEFLPPPAGSLHESAESDAPDADVPTTNSAEVARQTEPPLFESQAEPRPVVADAPPRRLPIPSVEAELLEARARVDREPPHRVQLDIEEVSKNGVRQAQFDQPAPTVKPTARTSKDKSFVETLSAADAHVEREEWLAAHKELSRLYWAEPDRRPEIMDRLNRTAQAIFFSPQPHFIEPHAVGAGDRLQTIASQHKLSWEYLAQLNQIDPKRIRAGQRLKVIRGPFSAVVELERFSMTVNLQGYYVKEYAVGVGKDGASPIGKHAVLDKVVNPQYTAPDGKVLDGDDPANPLGERWISLGNSYGIHGTIEPQSIGKAASRGCIRLDNDDVIEVYNFLVNGSEVVIRR